MKARTPSNAPEAGQQDPNLVGAVGASVGTVSGFITSTGLLALLVWLIAGCATAPRLDGVSTVAAQAHLRAAEELGAARVPAAALHASHARDELELARRLSNQGELRRADFLTKRAQLDAELALLLTKQAAAEVDADPVLLDLSTHPKAN